MKLGTFDLVKLAKEAADNHRAMAQHTLLVHGLVYPRENVYGAIMESIVVGMDKGNLPISPFLYSN